MKRDAACYILLLNHPHGKEGIRQSELQLSVGGNLVQRWVTPISINKHVRAMPKAQLQYVSNASLWKR